MQSGILLVDKPRGMTSHDVVARIRRLAGMRQVGHTGTLDPDASGLLILCLGRATRFARFFETLDKTYWAVMRLGIRTDTQDATGTVIGRAEVPLMPRQELEGVLQRFTGCQQQYPPMFSAVKYQGQRLYRLARQGQTVPRQPRKIEIQRCVLLDQRQATLTLAITCSKGTYIRTLCDDIGLALGCGAHVMSLQRCQVGPFSLRQACTLPFLQQDAAGNGLAPRLLPLRQALHFLPPLHLTPEHYARLRREQGGALPWLVATLPRAYGEVSGYRLCAPTHEPFAVLQRQPHNPETWKLSYFTPPEAVSKTHAQVSHAQGG